MRLSKALPIAGLTAILLTTLAPASRAQDPGVTVPSLEALVGNSTAIIIVRVKSLRLNETKRAVLELQLEVVDYLKRPPKMPIGDGEEVAEKPTISFSGDSVKQLRFYWQAYWSVDLSAPMTTIGFLPDAFANHSEVLFFQGFQSLESGQLHFLTPLTGPPIVLTDWTTLSSADAIKKEIQELVHRYRGVAQLRLALLDVRHFAAPLEQEGLVEKDSAPNARAFIVPADSRYEEMLLAQIKYPELLHEHGFMFSRTLWERNTRLIFPFDSPQNRALLKELLKDPEIGEVQKKLLGQILAAWK